LRAKIKDKSLGDTIGALISKVIENHKFWYKDSDLEDVVEDVKRDGAKVVAKAKAKAADIVADAKEEVADATQIAQQAVAKAKEEFAKAKVAPVKFSKKEDKKSVAKASASNSGTVVNP
jgi:hypothetical protein